MPHPAVSQRNGLNRLSEKALMSTHEKRSLDAIVQTGVSNTVGLPRKGLITSCAYVVRFRLVEGFRTARDGEFRTYGVHDKEKVTVQ